MAKEQIPSIHICTPEEIEGQRTACRLASELLDYITPYVEPGISTLELDNLIHRYTVDVQKCIRTLKESLSRPLPASR